MRREPGPISETGGAPRRGHGRRAGIWGGIPLADAAAVIAADPGLLGAMEAEIDEGSRSAAGGPFGWDVVAGRNGDGAEGTGSATRRATLTAIRLLLLLGRPPDAIASWIRAELGVVGIVVDRGSEIGRRLGCGRLG